MAKLKDALRFTKEAALAIGVTEEDITDEKLKGYCQILETEVTKPSFEPYRQKESDLPGEAQLRNSFKGPKIH